MAFLNSFVATTVGSSAVATIQFLVPLTVTTAGAGSVTLELLDDTGAVFSLGSVSNYVLSSNANTQTVSVDAVMPLPSTLPANNAGTSYQVRATLTMPAEQPQYLYLPLTALPLVQTEQGASDQVEIRGEPVLLQLTLPNNYAYVTADLYFGNDKITSTPPVVTGPTVVADGYVWSINLATNTDITPTSLVPYNVVWRYGASSTSNLDTEASTLYLVTPVLIQLAKDILMYVNKARTSLGDKPSFSSLDALSSTRLGMDYTNLSLATNFSFTKPEGPLRQLLFLASCIHALRSQAMFESESAFDFSGQSISLSVDRTQAYESMASALEAQFNDQTPKLKQLLNTRGITEGDGSANMLAFKRGSIGAIGVGLHAASNIRTSATTSYGIWGMTATRPSIW